MGVYSPLMEPDAMVDVPQTLRMRFSTSACDSSESHTRILLIPKLLDTVCNNMPSSIAVWGISCTSLVPVSLWYWPIGAQVVVV